MMICKTKIDFLLKSSFIINSTEMNFTEHRISVDLNKAKYMLMMKIADAVIQHGGMIYGGFVRDKVIHDYYASIFFDSHNNYKYSDPTNDSDSKLRLLIPNDIDMFLKGDIFAVERFFDNLQTSGFSCSQIVKDESDYRKVANINHLRTNVFFTHYDIMGMKKISIRLDMMYGNVSNAEPPFGITDMRCNQLILDINGVRLSNHLERNYEKPTIEIIMKNKRLEADIINNMLELKTDACFITDDGLIETNVKKLRLKRIMAMQERGWTIENITCYTLIRDFSSNERCPICLKAMRLKDVDDDDDDVIEREPIKYRTLKFAIHLNCCNLNVHIECFKQHIFTEYQTRNTPRCFNACSSRTDGWTI
jgi:hypothetical protein